MTTTNANGYYEFTGLTPGVSYTVTFGTPTAYIPTTANVGGDDAKDSDPVSGVVSGIILSSGEFNMTIDAGFILNTAAIGDTVWFDANKNGSQDIGEAGIGGVSVTLLDALTMNPVTVDAFGNPIGSNGTILSNPDGSYLFSKLVPGDYKVQFGEVAGYVRTAQDSIGVSDAKDSDASVINGITGVYTLGQGDTIRTVDAGYIKVPVYLCGNVFYDSDRLIDNMVDGSRNLPMGIYAVLVKIHPNLSESVVAVVAVPGMNAPGAGTFSFIGEANTMYYVMLSKTAPTIGNAPAPSASLPNTYLSTGEHIGAGPGSDGLVDGKSAKFTTGTTEICEINFGIRRFIAITID